MGNVKRGLSKINKCLDLPEGLLSGGTHIELQSNQKALIDGKCTVLQYSDEEIKMNTGSGIVSFKGKNLSIDMLNKESACISGIIKNLEFSK
ncbi:MAG: YabP/YqfC family sporulation protein [Acutalibacteraceae bacterium]